MLADGRRVDPGDEVLHASRHKKRRIRDHLRTHSDVFYAWVKERQ